MKQREGDLGAEEAELTLDELLALCEKLENEVDALAAELESMANSEGTNSPVVEPSVALVYAVARRTEQLEQSNRDLILAITKTLTGKAPHE